MKKPETHEEMVKLMNYLGIQEGYDFQAFVVEEGWADDKKAAVDYLESLDIFPWED